MRPLTAFALLAALAGCGEVEREKPRPPVRLTVSEPTDLAETDAESVTVRGTVVPPGARVLVAGAQAEVSGGSFMTTVALEEGANVIDVQADAPRRAAAMTALRVVREVTVTVPPLEGLETGAAVAALKDADLTAEVIDVGDALDDIFFGSEGVCGSSPGEGDEVPPGTTVVLEVAGACLD